MLLKTIRKQTHLDDSPFRAVEGPVAGTFFDFDPDVLKESEAKVVEDDNLRAHPVRTAETSEFTAFLDGIQRAEVKLYHDAVPIVYAYGAAVIRERHERQMRTLRRDGAEMLVEREALFYPSQHVPASAFQEFNEGELIDTTPPNAEPLPLFPPLLHARAAQHVNRWREALERELAHQWCEEADGWLMVDGSLTVSPDVANCKRAVGLMKSHKTRFFDGDDARVLLRLKCGERTSVFEPATRSVTPVRSWYLRIRPAERRDVFWGLVRVEIATSHDIAIADEISSWIMAEASPLSMPDSRWDRLLYPIHDCEEFLRARAPRL